MQHLSWKNYGGVGKKIFESELKGRTRRRRENPRLTWVEIVEKNVRDMRGKMATQGRGQRRMDACSIKEGKVLRGLHSQGVSEWVRKNYSDFGLSQFPFSRCVCTFTLNMGQKPKSKVWIITNILSFHTLCKCCQYAALQRLTKKQPELLREYSFLL